jgi:glycosyltransferase involved in cell wall biosynthesis
MHVLIASPVIAYPGVSHAGGEFLLRHIQALSVDHEVTLLVPRHTLFPQDEAKLPLAPCKTLIIDNTPSRLWPWTTTRFLRMLVDPTSLFSSFWSRVLRNPDARRAVDGADIIELQWFEMARTAKSIRRMGFKRPIFGFYHDVMSQRLAREFCSEGRGAHRLVKAIRIAIVRYSERNTARVLTMNVCLNDKDARILVSRGVPPLHLAVVNPPLDDAEMPVVIPDLSIREPIALFVGQFGRKENDQAARWFLREVWPDIYRCDKSFRIVLAGGGVSPGLLEIIDTTPGASATGYMPSLAPAYKSARVVVVPLLSGAGVKFKSITPMLWGIPVVATSVGAEGIPPELFFAIEDRAATFAKYVTSGLAQPSSCETLRQRSFLKCRSIYTQEAYLKATRELSAIGHA